MTNKFFIGVISILVLGVIGITAAQKNEQPPQGERPGVAHDDNGREHVAEGSKTYGGAIPPTSGDHGQPVPWQVYTQEVPDMNLVHNMEHGGIVVTYRPDLPADQLAKITSLFSKPFSREKFSPTKALVAPRAANESPIILSSWTRSMTFDRYDEEKMVEYYLRNIGKSPEPTAQ